MTAGMKHLIDTVGGFALFLCMVAYVVIVFVDENLALTILALLAILAIGALALFFVYAVIYLCCDGVMEIVKAVCNLTKPKELNDER